MIFQLYISGSYNNLFILLVIFASSHCGGIINKKICDPKFSFCSSVRFVIYGGCSIMPLADAKAPRYFDQPLLKHLKNPKLRIKVFIFKSFKVKPVSRRKF